MSYDAATSPFAKVGVESQAWDISMPVLNS